MKYKIGDEVFTMYRDPFKVAQVDGQDKVYKMSGGEYFQEHEVIGLATKQEHDSHGVAAHHKICRELSELYIEKNTDYGDSFSETYRDLGIISAVTRIVDKVNRLKRVSVNETKVKDETLRDTLIDLANYSIMTLMELDSE